MSITRIGDALDARADITPTERLILVQLARLADNDGMAFTSVGNLAQRANVSPSTVTRSVRRLAGLHLIQRIRNRNVAGVFSAYRVTLDSDGTEDGPA
ncbi:helix-turn-helix domain-containing protein [Streptomyces iakyrus]|uniref:Helix-turn-helix domain-containing protein n=1 Tax=Streptomyces iakyrus TaxID=68219 RepID=A0ABW8FSE8_9ACTN